MLGDVRHHIGELNVVGRDLIKRGLVLGGGNEAKSVRVGGGALRPEKRLDQSVGDPPTVGAEARLEEDVLERSIRDLAGPKVDDLLYRRDTGLQLTV